MPISAWMLGSASGGRARSVMCLITNVTLSATAAAAAAKSAAVGIRRLLVASQQAPAAANSGHLTHQADAITNAAVSGCQWS
ncbi:MAG: hypothetical protein ACRDNH_14905 [Gaiellaceae bacterium]